MNLLQLLLKRTNTVVNLLWPRLPLLTCHSITAAYQRGHENAIVLWYQQWTLFFCCVTGISDFNTSAQYCRHTSMISLKGNVHVKQWDQQAQWRTTLWSDLYLYDFSLATKSNVKFLIFFFEEDYVLMPRTHWLALGLTLGLLHILVS